MSFSLLELYKSSECRPALVALWGYELPDGIYSMSHEDFVKICDGIAADKPDRFEDGGYEVALVLDEVGTGERFLRTSPRVLEWARKANKVCGLDCVIGT